MRRLLRCRGTVQGVGFRPAVYRLATSLGLTGSVWNDADGASIEIEGPRRAADAFARSLTGALPPLARLEAVDASDVPPRADTAFRVAESAAVPRGRAIIPPDAALCDDCRREMDDPRDRRHAYPFTTCTNCGPRFSIARALPYDRKRTSMAPFPLCKPCTEEYEDVATRRFHAQPVCCPVCGPNLRLTDADGTSVAATEDALPAAQEAIASGKLVAVKGLGGFQLTCLADSDDVVRQLRERKRRPGKPFAIMVRELETARRLANLTDADERMMRSVRSPIVLVPVRQPVSLAQSVAPGIDDVGIMLPTTALHVELFRGAPYDALVMSSGNRSDEPIARTNEEALSALGRIADLFLLHDRDVVNRIDDSVVRSSRAGHVMVRRSRGWIPEPVRIPLPSPQPILAMGAFLQNTACIAVDEEAFLTQHVGDLDSESAREFLVEVIEKLESFLEVVPDLIVADLHPDYPSTWLGERLAAARGGRFVQVQHHLAHAAAVLGEHGRMPDRDERVGAIILDGTGYGMDETVWGGEFLSLDGGLRWRRHASSTPIRLVGGERAVREPWRVAVAALANAGCASLIDKTPMRDLVDAVSLAEVARLAEQDHWPLSTGAGRVFEAVGALLGLCARNGWEGEAAARCEALAVRCRSATPVWDEVQLPDDRNELPTVMLLAATAARLARGDDRAMVARGCHETYCRLAAELAQRLFDGVTSTIALGGGCFVNRILHQRLADMLTERGFAVLTPNLLPPGDGGIAYGQAVLAAAGSAPNARIVFEGDR